MAPGGHRRLPDCGPPRLRRGGLTGLCATLYRPGPCPGRRALPRSRRRDRSGRLAGIGERKAGRPARFPTDGGRLVAPRRDRRELVRRAVHLQPLRVPVRSRFRAPSRPLAIAAGGRASRAGRHARAVRLFRGRLAVPRIELFRDFGGGAVLARDVVAVLMLDDLFDIGERVPRPEEEERRLGADALVVGRRDLDVLGAGLVPTLAEDRHHVRSRPKRATDLLDALVHLAEKGLVPSDPTLALFHPSRSYNRGSLRL